ncbi:MAG: hypothetical protein ACPG8A_13905 [Psychrobium sp.]
MPEIKMSDVFDLPIDCHDFENRVALMCPFDAQIVADAINAHDQNKERIAELEFAIKAMRNFGRIDMEAVRACYALVDGKAVASAPVNKVDTPTSENALLENQLNNATAEISELKKKARGY